MKSFLWALFPFAFLVACGTPSPEGQDTLPFSIEPVELVRKAGPDCDSETASTCATVRLRYPVAKGSAQDSLFIQSFNDTIRQDLVSSFAMVNPTEGDLLNLQEAIDVFLTEYMDFIEEVPDYGMGWSIENDYQVLMQNEKVVSVEMESYSFSGGAHPNTFVTIFNFDRATGKTLGYPDLFSNPQGLLEVAEQAFRETRELESDADLEEAGFFWGEGFFLPASFGLTDTGVRFYYSPYEAAPYALGPTEFTIPYDQIGALIIKNVIFPDAE
jgi:hypothetical protein